MGFLLKKPFKEPAREGKVRVLRSEASMGHLAKNQHPGRSWKSLVMSQRALLIGLCVLALTMGTVGSASALTINFSSVDGATIAFDGTGKFTFPNTGTYDFVVGSVDRGTPGAGTVGLHGNLDGSFTIGAITQQTIGDIIYQTATVTGSGTFSIYDGTNTLVASLTWPNINSLKYNTAYSTGTLNFGSTPNLTVTSYGGSNPDLQFLVDGSPATITLTFTFLGENAGKSLTDLMAHPGATVYSGNVSAKFTPLPVPAPATLLLLGTGLVGLLGLRYRKRRKA
jgi:hypothetical protein